jgi:uncharacterized protein DUF4349
MTSQLPRYRAGFAVLTAALILLAGCSKNAGGTNDGAPVAAPAEGQRSDTGAGGTAAQPPTGAPALDVAPIEHSIVYTGSITVRVSNVGSAADHATAIAIAAGGHVGTDKRGNEEQASEADLVLRVPADRFDTTMADLARLGTELNRSTQAEDVTEAVVDINVRIAAQQASVDRVRTLLAKANSVGEVVSIESELTKREADLASLQARQRVLADQVALSTITITLLGPSAPVPAPAKSDTGFVAGLRAGWQAFKASVQIVLEILGALIPFMIALGLPLWLVIALVRRRRRNSPPTLAPVAMPAGPPPTHPGPAGDQPS